MKFVAISVPHNAFCKGCAGRLFKGDDAYRELSAAVDADSYCQPCAVAVVTHSEDPTRSVNQWYQSTGNPVAK